MAKFKVGMPVMLNPAIPPDDFVYGKAAVKYNEVGYVIKVSEDNKVLTIRWPQQRYEHWIGLFKEIIILENKE